MALLRTSKGFYIKAYDIPNTSVKTSYFNRLKYRFPSILLTQTIDAEKKDCCTHHIVIRNESRVRFFKTLINNS